MQLKHLSLVAALTGTALSQGKNLIDTLTSNKDLSMLLDLVSKYAELATTLSKASNITVLAPSNDALSAVKGLAKIDDDDVMALLMYHVLKGTYMADAITSSAAFVPTLLTDTDYSMVTGGQVVGAMMMGGDVMFHSGLLQESTVTTADIKFDGGVVHVIDTVLTVPMGIADTALAVDGLSAVAGALTETDSVDAVEELKDVTIFAPNNDAFQAIGSTLGELSITQLGAILQYHVVSGVVGYSSTLMDGMSLKTLAGQNVTITVDGDMVFVNGAMVTTPDVLVANGVIHVIDNILNPMMATATPSASATTGMPAFSGKPMGSQVPFTSGLPVATTTVTPTMPPPSPTKAGGTTTTTSGVGVPMKTAAMGAAALFGAGAALMNY